MTAYEKYDDPVRNQQILDGMMPPEERPINHDTTQPWKCMGCPMTSEDVERLCLDDHNYRVAYDPELHLCSRCKPDLASVTLALTEAIVLAHVDAGESLTERVDNLERHVLESTVDGTTDVEPAPDPFDQPEDDAPDKRYEEAVHLCVALWAHRDRLVRDATVDTFAARYSETNAVLGSTRDALHEVRKLLGLDTKKGAGSDVRTRNAVLGGVGGAIVGALLMASKNPLVSLGSGAKGALFVLRRMGIEFPDLPE